MADSSPTRRVELENERWVEVRRLNVGDITAAKLLAHDRGWEEADLDAIALLPRLITSCSDGEVNQEFINSLTEMDFGKVWVTAKGADLPNLSAPSSAGGSRRGKGKTSGLTNG